MAKHQDPSKSPQEDPSQPQNEAGQPVESVHGVNPNQILALLKVFGESSQAVMDLFQKLADAWQQRQMPKAATAAKVACPAGEQCCDDLIDCLAESLALALQARECCKGK